MTDNNYTKHLRSIMTLTHRVRLLCVLSLCVVGSAVFLAQPHQAQAVNLGTWATTTAAGNDDQWRSVAYGNGRFVAVGDAGDRVMYSNDGFTWTAVSTSSAAGNDDSWMSVTYGNGRFVAVGKGPDRVMTSDDGLTWTVSSAAGDDDSWTAVTFGSYGYFVAVGDTGGSDKVMYSSDGTSWYTASALGDDDNWTAVTYGNGRYVAVGTTGGVPHAMYSDNGFIWSDGTPLPGFWSSVTYGNGRFLAVSNNGSGDVMYSEEGVIWTRVHTNTASVVDGSIFFGNNLFMNVTNGQYVSYSPDGLIWRQQTLPQTSGWTGVVYGENRFVAVSSSTGNARVMYATSSLWSLAQTGFQFRNDNGSEVTATSIKGQNSPLEFPLNARVRLRTQIDSQLATTTTPYYLQYKNTGAESNWHTIGVDDPYPSIRSTWSGYSGSDMTTHNLQQTPCLVGDLNLVIFSHDGVQTSRSTSTGWSKLGEESNGVAVTGAVYYKFADGNDNLVVTTVGNESASYVSYCIAGAGTPTATAANGSSANSDAPLHNTDAVRNYLFLATRSGDATTVATAAPAGYGPIVSQTTFSSTGATTDVAVQFARASTTNPGVFTSATEQWVAWTIAVPPRQTPTVGSLEGVVDITPATSTNNSGFGSIAWTNPGRATSSDELRATVTVSSTTASNYLNVTDWGFAIPSNAVITGITAAIEKVQSGGTSGFVRDNSIRLIKGGTVVGNNYASTTANWLTSEYVSNYGSSTNLWGTTWNPADINASNFGIAIAVAGSAVGANRIANIDHVTINVYYTVPPPFTLALSPNIASGGASTTAKMIAPTIHTKADFTGGHITEDQTPTPSVTIAASSYTELEWSLLATSTASTSDTYEFRTSIGLAAPVQGRAGNILFTIAPTTTTAFITLSGTAYSDLGSTTVGSGQEIVIAIGEENPILYATTTTSGGAFTISVATSTGNTFVPVTTEKSSDTLVSVTYGRGQFVAITPGDTVLTSKNGMSWTKRPAAGSNATWKDITYGNGLFVAVGSVGAESGDPIMFSSDGIQWQTANPNNTLNQNWTSVTYARGLFVAVGDSTGGRVAYSRDAVNWTVVSNILGDNDTWSGITYGNRRFVAVANGGDDRVMTSSNGISWTARTAAGDNDSWKGITYGKGRFVAVGNSGDRAMYSNDGISWTAVSAAGNDDAWTSVKYGNGRYMAVGNSGDNRAMYSLDGVTWVTQTTRKSTLDWNKVTYGRGKFVIVGSPVGGDSVTTISPSIGPDTNVVVYRKSTSSPSTTFVSGLDGLSGLTGIPLYTNTMLVYNATTSGTTSVTDLGELEFYDGTDDSNILYNSPSATTTSVYADMITATGTTKASNYLNLQGDFTQNGLFDSNDGTIEFTGSDSVVRGDLSSSSVLSSVLANTQSGGTNWRPVTNAGNGGSWLSVTYGYDTYGNGRFVAVGNAGDLLMYSDDGVNWATTSVAGNDDSWQSVTYGNGRFVAVGDVNDKVMTSTDGITWTAVSASGDDDAWYGVTYGNGRFVAVAFSGDRIMYSDDGLAWTTVAGVGTGSNWFGVTYGNGRFVAVGYYGDPVMYSDDGITWTTTSAAGNDDFWQSVTYGNGRFVAVGKSGDRVMYSDDGITWTAVSAAGDDDDWNDVTYSNGRFVAVGGGGDRVMTSTDGLTWATTSAAGDDDGWGAITYGNGRFVAVGSGPDFVMTSFGSLSFDTPTQINSQFSVTSNTLVNAPTSTLTIGGDVVQNGYFNPRNGTTTLTSPNGSVVGDFFSPDLFNPAMASGQLVIDGNSTYNSGQATIYNLTVNPGGAFTAPTYELTLYGNYDNRGTVTNAGTTTFAGVAPYITGSSTGEVFGSLVSSPQLSFTTFPVAGNDDNWNSVTYGNGRFVAVGSSGDILMTSTDGLTWATTTAAGDDDGWRSVTYGNGRFVAVGETGDRVMTSTDGQTWIPISAAGDDDSWYDITYGNGRFVAVAYYGNDLVMTSTDGLTWAPVSAAGDDDNWNAVTYGNGRFVAVGFSGDRVMYSDDGLTWTPVSAAGDDDYWTSVTYGNGRFVAVGNSGDRVMYSDDGLTWTSVSAAGNDDDWQSVTYGNGRYVAVGIGGDVVITSTDGITWTPVSAADNNDSWNAITYGNGRFVVLAYSGGDRVMTALGTGGQLQIDTPLYLIGSLVIADATTLLAPTSTLEIAGNFINRGVFYPRAGTTTLSGGGSTITGNLTSWSHSTGLDYGLTRITGVYNYIGNGTTSALVIDSGGSLTNTNGGTLAIAHDFINNGTFSSNGATTMFSGDLAGDLVNSNALGNIVFNARSQGSEWQAIATSSALGNNDIWTDVTYGNGRFVAVGGNTVGSPDSYGAYSDDGLSWATTSAPNNNWQSVTFGNGMYVAVSTYGGGPIMTSVDGITWTSRSPDGIVSNWTDVTYGNGRFVAVGAYFTDNRVMYSDDGITWATSSAAGNNDDWLSVTYGNGRFVAVGDDTTGDGIMYSDDGITWATTTVPGDPAIYSNVAYGNGRFVAVTGYDVDGPAIYSLDGINWVKVADAPNFDWEGLVFGNGYFVAVANSIMYSRDGITWATTPGYASGVTYGNSRFVAVSCGGSGGCGTDGDRFMVAQPVSTIFTNASTTNLIINAGSILNASGTTMSVAGDYTNNGLLMASSSTFVFNGTSTQMATGTLSASSSFNNLTITNTSGDGLSMQSVQFGAPVSANGTMTMIASTSAQFLASSTNAFNNVVWTGNSTAPVWLRSSVNGQEWNLDIIGTQNISFVDVSDSNASSTIGGVANSNGFDSGNNTNWFFGGTPSLELANHPLGQINNTFSNVNKVDEPLFAFTLTPAEIQSASTTISLTLANTVGLDSTNLSDWRLYRDSNGDRMIDGGDIQVGGAGSFSTTSVIFTTPFLITTSQSYIVTADVIDINQGDRITISLEPGSVVATSTQTGLTLPVVGAVSSTNHLRSKKGGGGGSVNFINIGAPGNGIVGGGGNTGGEELGGEPNFNRPTSNGSPHNEWANGSSGYVSDNTYTSETTAGERQSYATYGFTIPDTNQITGIEVKLEASASTPAGTIEVALSWDNGTSITTTRTTATLSTTDTIYTLGSPSDLWGRAWVPSEFSNGTFGLRLIGQPSGGNTVQVDAMQVRIYHQTGGGGTGGGSGEL